MDLKGLTAVELGKKIQAKEVTVKEAVEACFAQIDKVEKEVNSFVSLQKEAALKRAEEVQKLIDDGTLTGPLAGVPVAIKDNMCTEGVTTTCSSKILSNFVPTFSAEAVLNLEKAGAVVIGRLIWMNLRWEARLRLLIMERQRIRGIWSMYRVDLPVAPVRQLRLWKYHMLLDLTPADRSVSQVLTAESLESSQPTERYPVMD